MPRLIVCSDPFHDSRRGEAGWCESLGYRPGDDGPPLKFAAQCCQACGAARQPIARAAPMERLAEHLGVSAEELQADLSAKLVEVIK